MPDYKTPGVYIEEISTFPPSVAQVETAIPAFIGYTQQATDRVADDLHLRPKRIKSLTEFVRYFGGPIAETFAASIDANDVVTLTTAPTAPTFYTYYALKQYYDNGGGPCYMVSVGQEGDAVSDANMLLGLAELAKEDEPTLILFPDAPHVTTPTNHYNLYVQALAQCETLKDRFVLVDVQDGVNPDLDDDVVNGPDGLRSRIGSANLKYGAAYFPHLLTLQTYHYDETALDVTLPGGGPAVALSTLPGTPSDKYYHLVRQAIARRTLTLPPSSSVAGVYATIDRTRGVWKAPANVSLRGVKETLVAIDRDTNDRLNVDPSGKSVNAIRFFHGKGVLVWGARTLAGNDNEWRYVPVRRFYNMAEESIKKATEQFVFEPNDANTWVKVRAMIENFLVLQWRAGALAGAKPEDAFFVRVGLGVTMTPLDILEGRMNVEIGMAVVRPAEFIILKFSHKMQES